MENKNIFLCGEKHISLDGTESPFQVNKMKFKTT
jgi:hypothetical protein